MSQFLIPAEQWETIASANSCALAAEHKGHKPLSVRTAECGGFLYTAFATMYGPYGEARKPFVEAYRLLPQSMYAGDTTLVYHDEKAIQAGLRDRGDHTGLIVSVRGELMVCAEKVQFVMDLPGTRPLSQAEAEEYDERQRRWGWRSFWFSDAERVWHSLRGHPVVRYWKDEGDSRSVLFWKSGREIHEISISDDVALSPLDQIEATAPQGQLALF
jgi:hypothetical protein